MGVIDKWRTMARLNPERKRHDQAAGADDDGRQFLPGNVVQDHLLASKHRGDRPIKDTTICQIDSTTTLLLRWHEQPRPQQSSTGWQRVGLEVAWHGARRCGGGGNGGGRCFVLATAS